jgi:hypothetical protein
MALMRFERAHEAIPESRRTVLVGDILNVDSMTFNCKFKEHDGILNRSIGLDNFRMIIEIIHPLFVSSSSS